MADAAATSAVPALELHEVLEQEFVSMYGESPALSGPEITDAQLCDANVVRDVLQKTFNRRFTDSPTELARVLETLRVRTQGPDCPAVLFRGSSRLSSETELLIRNYDSYSTDEVKQRINRRILDDVFEHGLTSFRDLRLADLYRQMRDKPRSALCISGGGIRSATFALGLMQGLARLRILKNFNYLSTVSGGGYIGSWLSSWARRHPDGIDGVEKDLAALEAENKEGVKSKMQPEAKPIRHLREYSNYLTPKLGMLSGDMWAFMALYIRNLVVNLLIIVPLLAALLALPRVVAWSLNNVEAVPLWLLLPSTAAFLTIMFWYIGAARPVRHGRGDDDVPKWIRKHLTEQERFLVFCTLAAILSCFGLLLTWAKLTTIPPPFESLSLVDRWTIVLSSLVTFAGMTVIPSSVYFRRYRAASFAARRDGLSEDDQARRDIRIEYERWSAFASAAVGVGLFWLAANKVFDVPLTDGPPLEGKLPLAIAAMTSTSHAKLLYVVLGMPVALLIFFLQATIFVAGSSLKNEDYDREWWGRAGGWLLGGAAAWALLAAVSIYGPLALYRFPVLMNAIGGVSGLAAILLGRSAKTGNNKGGGTTTETASNASLAVAVPLFALFLLASISCGTTWFLHCIHGYEVPPNRAFLSTLKASASREETFRARGLDYKVTMKMDSAPAVDAGVLAAEEHFHRSERPAWKDLVVVFALAGLAFILSRVVGVNRFSMHALYRNRLIRAYLGASRYERDPDRFTGFDPYDNMPMWSLRHELLWYSSICDLDSLVQQLKNAPDGSLAGLVHGKLKDNTKKTISEYLDGRPAAEPPQKLLARIRQKTRAILTALRQQERLPVTAAELHEVLFQDLNRVILDEDLRLQTAEPLSAEQRVRNNRAVLEQTFPKCIQATPRAPFHIINTALNLVSGDNLAWQQRQAEPFSISPLHCGTPFLGYRDARVYGDRDRGISVGTAVTISGAAASPNMGYHSSPALAFLLTMFNVRLGWWLGNPGEAGRNTFAEANPRGPVGLLYREAIGDTNDRCDWVYLSDGGHFENLGLYEMVLRRCRHIVVSDAGCDPKFQFEDLGNAIRKIRIDLGIKIKINTVSNMSPRGGKGESYCAVGTIDYKSVDGEEAENGVLIYFKPGVYDSDKDLPNDVYNYAAQVAEFPHESTGDQWFSESQFESYRMLGSHVMNEAVKKAGGQDKIKSVANFATELRDAFKPAEKKTEDAVFQEAKLMIKAPPRKEKDAGKPLTVQLDTDNR